MGLRDYLLAELGKRWPTKGKKRGLKWHGIAEAWVNKGLAGSERALSELRDTLEGRPLQRQEISGIDGMPIMIGASRMMPPLIVEGTPPVVLPEPVPNLPNPDDGSYSSNLTDMGEGQQTDTTDT